MTRARTCAVVLAVGALAAACKETSGGGTPDAAASPQASAMPAPLANAPNAASATATAAIVDSGPTLVPLRGDLAPAADAASKEPVGYALSAVFRLGDLSGPPRVPEVNNAGLDAARRKTELRLSIDLTPSRMRVVLGGSGFVLPAETEIRARADRSGHVVVWPGGGSYRPLAPGAMRALLGERRFDVAPIAAAEVDPKDESGKRIGIRTRHVDVTTRAAKATFEIGRLGDLGDGGVLLCRVLLDLMSAPPQSPVCGTDEVPMRAELRWTNRGSFTFEVTGVLKKGEVASILVPPAGASFAEAPFPTAGIARLLSAQELAGFRTGPVEAPAGGLGPDASAPDSGAIVRVGPEGLAITNASDELRVLTIDGIAVAWAAPGAKDVLPGLPHGRYIAQWRTFLGDAFDPPVTQLVPGSVPSVDAGAR